MTPEEMLPTLNMDIYKPPGVTAGAAVVLQEREDTQAKARADMFASLQQGMDATTARMKENSFSFGQING